MDLEHWWIPIDTGNDIIPVGSTVDGNWFMVEAGPKSLLWLDKRRCQAGQGGDPGQKVLHDGIIMGRRDRKRSTRRSTHSSRDFIHSMKLKILN